jgi:hypothetical protein
MKPITPHILTFIMGACIALACYFLIQDSYEARIFKALSKTVLAKSGSESRDAKIIAAVEVTYSILKARSNVFVNSPGEEPAGSLIGDLIAADGACGSYAKVVTRLLSELDIECRISQLNNGKHIIAEAYGDNNWIAIDPSYNLVFVDKYFSNKFASIEEISFNWNYYKDQVPASYNPAYNYESYTYTNWNKIPVLMPMLKGIINIFTDADKVSLRSGLLRVNLIIAWLYWLLFNIVLYYAGKLWIKEGARQRRLARSGGWEPVIVIPKRITVRYNTWPRNWKSEGGFFNLFKDIDDEMTGKTSKTK